MSARIETATPQRGTWHRCIQTARHGEAKIGREHPGNQNKARVVLRLWRSQIKAGEDNDDQQLNNADQFFAL